MTDRRLSPSPFPLPRRERIKGEGLRNFKYFWLVLLACSVFLFSKAASAETVTLAIPTKTFQNVVYPIAQERGYMKEEGIELKLVFIEPVPSVQALMAGSVQFTAAGASGLIGLAKSSVPVKVVVALNDRVHQWILTRPNITHPKDLKGRKIATTGVAAIATFMLKQILAKHGIDGNKDVFYLDPGSGNQLTSLLTGVADAAVLSAEQRYAGLDAGMHELFYYGNEVKNSWGILATSDRIIKERPKLVADFVRATLKGIRRFRQDRDGSIAAIVKFSGVDRGLATRVYDDLIGTFTSNGAVDDETQRNDLAIVRQVAGVNETIPIARAYDFSFALDADQQLNRTGWRP